MRLRLAERAVTNLRPLSLGARLASRLSRIFFQGSKTLEVLQNIELRWHRDFWIFSIGSSLATFFAAFDGARRSLNLVETKQHLCRLLFYSTFLLKRGALICHLAWLRLLL